MGLRWHLPIGPGSISGRVVPRRRKTGPAARRIVDALDAAGQAVANRDGGPDERAEVRAAKRRFRENAEALRVEEARLAEERAAAEHLAELGATAIVHERDGMPESAAQFRRMADEFRAENPTAAARVILPREGDTPPPRRLTPEEEARAANERVRRGETRAAGAPREFRKNLRG